MLHCVLEFGVASGEQYITCLKRRKKALLGVPGLKLLTSSLSLGVVGGRLGSLQCAYKLLQVQRRGLAGHFNREVHHR